MPSASFATAGVVEHGSKPFSHVGGCILSVPIGCNCEMVCTSEDQATCKKLPHDGVVCTLITEFQGVE